MTIGISPLRRSDFEDGGIVEFSMMERNECQEYYKEIKEMNTCVCLFTFKTLMLADLIDFMYIKKRQ